MFFNFPPSLLVDVFVAHLVLHKGWKPVEQIEHLLLLFIERLFERLNFVVGYGQFGKFVSLQLFHERFVVDYDLSEVVVLLLASPAEVLTPGQVLFLSDNWQCWRNSLVEDALLPPQISALDDTAALCLFYVLEGAVGGKIFSRFSPDLRFSHDLADLFGMVLLLALNWFLQLSY